ncbi:MAG: aminotransferase class I/II-fold pyridoxal phosphate-dependent enzyme [Waddliaceae bacterium]|nr:aminotransferase class I/II-fold pyridoxal phosphate-dependent enzyme [Waddliaceae bacterium]
MNKPILSHHFTTRQPSSIRLSQIEFLKRTDGVEAINVAIGNVSLPMHPAMIERMKTLTDEGSPFSEGVVSYSPSMGAPEANIAFKNIIASSGFDTANLRTIVTDGGSMAMELMILGVCGAAGADEKPLMLIDAVYTNYISLAERTGRKTVSVRRTLLASGQFSMPDIAEIEEVIKKNRPGALLVIPYDNPTGHFINIDMLTALAKLCVRYNMWLVSDEAYRELFYTEEAVSSIWAIDDALVKGIEGRRISIESASKVWNGCGLRVGALVTDNQEFYNKALAEYTSNLCANTIGQYIFGALAHEKHEDIRNWYQQQREYYKPMMNEVREGLIKRLPGIIVSSPSAALYSVIDVRDIAKPSFNSKDFVLYCAQKGSIEIDGKNYTLLVTSMSGFYKVHDDEANPGDCQMRIAYVLPPDTMRLVPVLFEKLFHDYERLQISHHTV